MKKLYYENNLCKIFYTGKQEYIVSFKKDFSHIRRVLYFKPKEIIDHYYYSLKYKPRFKWYFILPVLIFFFIAPMVWVDLMRDSLENTSFWKGFETMSAIITFTSFGLLLLYIFIDCVFKVEFINRLIGLVFQTKQHWYFLKIKGNEKEGVEIPLENSQQQFELIEALKLTTNNS